MTSTERRFPHYRNGEPMYWRKWAIVLVSMPVGIVVQCLLCSVLCSAILGSVSVLLPDPKASAVSDVKCVLSSIESTTTSPPPQRCAFALDPRGDDECRTFFQDALRENSGKYEARVTYYSMDDPKPFRDVDEIQVGVFFPDGQEGTFDFYAGGLVWCGKRIR